MQVLRRDDVKVGARIKRKSYLSERFESSPRYYLLLFTTIYLVAECLSKRRDPFWVDEITTYNLANLRSIADIWPLLQQGIELNPPLPFWIAWVIHHTIGGGEVLTRLPSLFGFWAMCLCLCLFWFVRRRSDATFGFIALLVPLFTYPAWDATNARGYGLMLGFSAASMLCWQLAADHVRRPLVLAGLAICIAGAISCHYYAVYVAGAIFLGELVRTWQDKRIDWLVLVSIFVGTSSLLAYVPLLGSVMEGSKAFWITPFVRFLYESYADLFGPAAMVLLAVLIAALRIPAKEQSTNRQGDTLRSWEMVACAALAAMPLMLFVAAEFTPIAFFSRYVQPVVIGFSIAVPMFAYRMGGKNPPFRNLIASSAVWLCFAPWALWHATQTLMRPEPWTAIKTRLQIPDPPPSLPLVIDQEDDSAVAYHYAPPAVQQILYSLYDPSSSVRYLGSDTMQHTLYIAQTFRDLHLISYREFTKKHREFLLERARPAGWVLQQVLADGGEVRLVRLDKGRGVFVEDRMLFHVIVR